MKTLILFAASALGLSVSPAAIAAPGAYEGGFGFESRKRNNQKAGAAPTSAGETRQPELFMRRNFS
jgi:hypothetical protein